MQFSLARRAWATAKIESIVHVALSAIDFSVFTSCSNNVLLTPHGGSLHRALVGTTGGVEGADEGNGAAVDPGGATVVFPVELEELFC